MVHELPVSDPKDYSSLMGRLARQVRDIMRSSRDAENSICVSSGTAEMRAAWFLLKAAGVLPATLLQVGSPARPLFGAANVKEVRLDTGDWRDLRDLVMPQAYFSFAAGRAPLRISGSALIILGRVREAEAEARTAVALDRTDMKAQYLLGYLLALRPETRAAGEEYLRYAARELLDAHSMLAELYERTGRGALAEAEWEMYIQGVNAQAGGRHGGSRARPRAR